jgi:hypothetical protein
MMKPIVLALALLIAGQRVARAQDPVAGEICFEYQPAPVHLIGHLERITYPGAPNFTNIAAGDQAETGLYLRLAHGLCTVANKNNEAKNDVSLLQLMVDSAGYASLRPDINKEVTVRGTLLPAMSGHHHTPVIMMPMLPVTVDSVKP